MGLLAKADKDVVEFAGIMPNPTYAKVQEGAKLAREKGVDFILAVGGGSVIDCVKIVSVQAKTDRDVWKMELSDHEFPTEGIPMGAVVTIFGTGAEMNNGAVITNEATKQKNGMAGSFHSFAVLDPAYTLSAPMKQALSGAFDMLSHSMETHFGTPHDGNLSDLIAEANMRCIIENTRKMIAAPAKFARFATEVWGIDTAGTGPPSWPRRCRDGDGPGAAATVLAAGVG